MGFRNNIRKLAYSLRRLPGERFEIRPYTVTVNVSAWAGDHVGEGVETVTSTAITEANGQPPRVRIVSTEQRALGSIPDGSWEVGPVTPDFPGGGTSWTTLTGGAAAAEGTVTYTLTGPEFPTGAQFVLHEARSDKTFGYRLILKPLAAK